MYKLEASRRARAEKSYREGKTHWMVTHTRPLTLILILTLTLTLTLTLALALALSPPLAPTLTPTLTLTRSQTSGCGRRPRVPPRR